jgi:hypothetical protein
MFNPAPLMLRGTVTIQKCGDLVNARYGESAGLSWDGKTRRAGIAGGA